MKSLFVTLILLGIIGYIGYKTWIGMAASGFGDKLERNKQTWQDVDK